MYAIDTAKLQQKSFLRPDEQRIFSKGQVEVIAVGEFTFGRATLQPGWKWSTCVKPVAQTELCEAAHLQFQLSGRLHLIMEDGTEIESVAGDVVQIPPGHDAWVVGKEPVVAIDITGMKNYAKQPTG